MKRYWFVSFILFLISCSSSFDPNVLEQDQSMKEKIELACNDAYLSEFISDQEDRDFLIRFYASNDHEPLWYNDSVISEFGKKFEELLKIPLRIGLPQGHGLMTKTKNEVQQELAFTLAFSRSINAVQNGFLDLEKVTIKAHRTVSIDSTKRVYRSFEQHLTDSIHLAYRNLLPTDSTYQQLYNGLLKRLDRLTYDNTTFHVESIKVDSLKAISETKKALVSKGYCSVNDLHDPMVLDSVLRLFQQENGLKPDGVVGKYTAKALNESNVEKFHRILLSMEKVRSSKRASSKFILINLPEYKLRFFESDTLRSEHKIIIGNPETPTPELESKLSKIIVYPYWNVPYSIASKEILPSVKRNVNYLARNNYRIYRKEVEVNPYHVNWARIKENAFPYKVVQDPGPTNSLGILKFDFPNSYSVYFHDTPSKGLFGADIRAFSHGCMRTHKPIELAKKILDYDSIPRKRNDLNSDSLDTLLARAKNYEIRLLDRIPIFIIYQTVCFEKNQLITYVDIYDRDKKYIKVML